ncbi:hypothetical protein ACFE04_005855 [Oxalis oulophora]
MGREESPSPSSSSLKSQLAVEICYISTRPIACAHIQRNTSHFIDWCSILRVEDDAQVDAIRKQYHKLEALSMSMPGSMYEVLNHFVFVFLALQLHPDKNKHSKAELAFKLVHEAYTCLSDTSKRKAFNLERRKYFCRECNRIPFVKLESPANFHGPKPNTNRSGSNKIMQDIRDRFREEASVIENCLRATALSRKESPMFDPGSFLDRKKSRDELPVFNPSDYVFQGYPHIRTKIYDKNQYFERRNNVVYEQRRGSCDFPIFEHRQEIRMYKKLPAGSCALDLTQMHNLAAKICWPANGDFRGSPHPHVTLLKGPPTIPRHKDFLAAVALVLLLALINAINGEAGKGRQCDRQLALEPRPHSVSIIEFGAVGDGKTLNTIALQNAVFYLKSFADKGGAQLYVPPGRWLTGSFNLTSHLTLFLDKGAIIIGSEDPSHWEVVDPLPSYGRGIELPGPRYRSLINGYKLEDVVITGDNGTIDGQGFVWWDWFNSHSLNYSRPHLVEFEQSDKIVISNVSFVNAPAYNIHPVYCSNVHVHNTTIYAPPDSPYTVGIVPDSSNDICIEDSSISVGHDAISLKSGWDEYGISYGRPTAHVHIRSAFLQSKTGSSISFGSEMSGGISNILVEDVALQNSFSGIEFRTTKGRGGYMKQIFITNVTLENVNLAFSANGQCGSHPDEKYDDNALPVIDQITIQNVDGSNITTAGVFTGIKESPFTSICLTNITLSLSPSSVKSWVCSNVVGVSELVIPAPCPALNRGYSNYLSACYTLLHSAEGKSSSL